MRKAFHKIHKTIGLLGAVYMLLMSSTGTILLFRDDVIKSVVIANDQPCPTHTFEKLHFLIKANAFGAVTSLKMPTESMPAFLAYQPDKSYLLIDCHLLTPLDDTISVVRFFQAVFDLHHYLLLGDLGENTLGLFGILAIITLVIGFYIWIPWRKGFRLKALTTNKNKPANARAAHIVLSIINMPLLLALTLTGLSMIYGSQFRSGLASIYGGDKTLETIAYSTNPFQTLKDKSIDSTTIRFLQPHQDGVNLRLQLPGELHPNGRSMVYQSDSTQKTQLMDARTMGLGHRIFDTLYPLHSAKGMPLIYKVLLLIAGLMTWLSMAWALKAVKFKQGRSSKYRF